MNTQVKLERVYELLELAKIRCARKTTGISNEGVPGGKFSDAEVELWENMCRAIRKGGS